MHPSRIILASLCLAIATHAQAAGKLGTKVTLTCDFPAAEAIQKVKPGKSNVSDGVIRITAEKLSFKICNGCKWQKNSARWKVTPAQYVMKSAGGVEITISRSDGSALFAVTSKEDELYFAAHAESRGQCKIAQP